MITGRRLQAVPAFCYTRSENAKSNSSSCLCFVFAVIVKAAESGIRPLLPFSSASHRAPKRVTIILARPTNAARHLQRKTQFQSHSRTRRRATKEKIRVAETPIRHSKASRHEPPLRFPPRTQRRPALVGRSQRAEPRSLRQAPRDARRGSPARIRRLRRSHSRRRIWRRHCDGVGQRHVGARSSGHRGGSAEGRLKVHIARQKTARLLGARSHARLRRQPEFLAPHQTSRRVRLYGGYSHRKTALGFDAPPSRRYCQV